LIFQAKAAAGKNPQASSAQISSVTKNDEPSALNDTVTKYLSNMFTLVRPKNDCKF